MARPAFTTFDEYALISTNYQQQAAFFCLQTSKVGVLGGAVAVVASTFFDYHWLYPATIAGLSLCAWAHAELSLTSQQEEVNNKLKNTILSFIPQNIRKYIDSSSSWVEFKRWPPVSNDHTLPPLQGWSFWKNLFFSREREYVEIRALTNGKKIKYETLNLNTNAISVGDIHLGCPLEEMVEQLKICHVALEDNGTPVFSHSYHTVKVNDCVVELLLRKNDLIWNIYKPNREKVTSTKKYSLSDRCSKATVAFFNSVYMGPIENRIRLVKESILSIPSDTICFEPKHTSSHFQYDVLISKFMWAITLIRNEGPSGNHAEIIIEGINDGFFSEELVPVGEYFMYLADLLGGTEIKKNGTTRTFKAIRTKLQDRYKLQYQARSSTWKRSSELVEKMIRNIEKEKADPSEGFSRLGCHSIFSSSKIIEDSCITWAITKLSEIEVYLKKTDYAFLFTNTSLYTPLSPHQQERHLERFLFWTDQSKLI